MFRGGVSIFYEQTRYFPRLNARVRHTNIQQLSEHFYFIKISSGFEYNLLFACKPVCKLLICLQLFKVNTLAIRCSWTARLFAQRCKKCQFTLKMHEIWLRFFFQTKKRLSLFQSNSLTCHNYHQPMFERAERIFTFLLHCGICSFIFCGRACIKVPRMTCILCVWLKHFFLC